MLRHMDTCCDVVGLTVEEGNQLFYIEVNKIQNKLGVSTSLRFEMLHIMI